MRLYYVGSSYLMDDGEGKYVGGCRCVAPTLAICIAPAVIGMLGCKATCLYASVGP